MSRAVLTVASERGSALEHERHSRGASWRDLGGTAFAVRMARGAVAIPAFLVLWLIRIYQRTVSPALPVIFGAACGCRFAPTCSHYAADAIRSRGLLIGVGLAAIRLVKCTPLHPGGFDPVPPRRTRRTCVRIPS